MRRLRADGGLPERSQRSGSNRHMMGEAEIEASGAEFVGGHGAFSPFETHQHGICPRR